MGCRQDEEVIELDDDEHATIGEGGFVGSPPAVATGLESASLCESASQTSHFQSLNSRTENQQKPAHTFSCPHMAC